jgi:hypothetical protein
MRILTQQFKLPFNTVVRIRIQAETFAGKGPWSFQNLKGAKVRAKPQKMPMPRELNEQISGTLSIKWSKILTKRMAGGSFILEYILEGTKGKEEFKEIYKGQKTEYKLYEPMQGTIYRFRVKARNVYGSG